MQCIDELFDLQVQRAPDAVAVEFEGRKLTYRELNSRADELAGQLRGLGVGPDTLVALFLDRSLDMVVSLLGVLKAGGAYLPLDPVLPRKRLAYMLADAQPPVVITQVRLQFELPATKGCVLVIDAEAAPAVRPEQTSAPGRTRDPRDLAYVIYTSGSTGEPKGVEIEHRAVVNMLGSMQRRPGLGAEDTILAITTLAFDIAALEIFLPLVSGARVVIAPSQTTADGRALIDLIEDSGATILQATPATLRMLLDSGWAGDGRLKVLCGGEAWTQELANQLLPRCGSLWNMYGPTETTVWSAVAKVEAGRPIAIGPPIAKTKLYVLDGSRQLVPVGVPGELYIGGDALARGYLRRPELTRERFVADPFSEQPGARMYRTGDLVRRRKDGALEFLGRIDHQVKIRGHRIELGEIEAALARHPSVEQAAVAAREDTPGDLRLVAYMIPSAGAIISGGELRLVLGETLPDYMIPTAFVSLVSFPLTPNGKLDRKALPPPDAAARETDVTAVEPRSETERTLERIWCEALGLERIDVRANFFSMGGHSIMAASVIRNINKTLDARAGAIDLFQSPTIETLAETIERNRQNRKRPSLNDGGRVVRLKDGSVGLPIFFIGAGPVEHYIGQMIHGDRAVFATDVPLPPEWRLAIAGADRSALPNIAQLGALHARLVHAHARSSPCVVAGYSFGGKLAFETAKALQLGGGSVAFVLLIDAFTWSGYIRGAAQRSLQSIWRGVATRKADDLTIISKISVSLADSWRLLMWLLARAPVRVKSRVEAPSLPQSMFDEEGRPIDQAVINQLARIAGKSFQPEPLDAAGVLIRGRLPSEDKLPGLDRTNGWGDLFTRGLEIIQTTGDHASIFSDEGNRAELALHLNAVLDRGNYHLVAAE